MNKGTIIISGASQGLGAHLAKTASSRGYSTASLARNRTKLESLQSDLHCIHEKQKHSIHECDLTMPEQVQSAMNNIFEEHQDVVGIVNFAATWTGGTEITDLSYEEMRRSMELNFYSTFHVTKALLDRFHKDQLPPLCIINMGATASLRSKQRMSPFSIAKGAIRFFSQSLARELGPQGVHVAHLIIDGLIDNDRTRKLNPNVPKEKFISQNALSDEILRVFAQEDSCWTFEWDVRPKTENW